MKKMTGNVASALFVIASLLGCGVGEVSPSDGEGRTTNAVKAAHQTIVTTRPRASQLVVDKLNDVLKTRGINFSLNAADVEKRVASRMTSGQPATTCPYLTKSNGTNVGCRDLVDAAVKAAIEAAPTLAEKRGRSAMSANSFWGLTETELTWVKGWASEAVLSGIDTGATHSLELLRRAKVCDQAPGAMQKAFDTGEQQGKALLEAAELKVIPATSRAICNTGVIADSVQAEAEAGVDAFVQQNPLCSGATLAETVDLAQAEQQRRDGIAEGIREAYESLRVRLVTTWKCSPDAEAAGGDAARVLLPPQSTGGTTNNNNVATIPTTTTDTNTNTGNTNNTNSGSDWWNSWTALGGGSGDFSNGSGLGSGSWNTGWDTGWGTDFGGGFGGGFGDFGGFSSFGDFGYDDPLVVNLDGQGVRFSGQYVTFDLAASGEPVKMPALASGSALLALDLDGDGRISSGSELLGNAGSCGERRCLDGIEALASHDSNHDGVIDHRDPVFARLVLWTDRNADGMSDATELRSLADAGIASISLGSRLDRSCRDQSGNSTIRSLSFTRQDGSAGMVLDVWFKLQGAQARTVSSLARRYGL
jgi:hypothetical protein